MKMCFEWTSVDAALSKRLLDQHEVAIDALGGSLLLFPFDSSLENLKILESGCADGMQVITVHQPVLIPATKVIGYSALA